MTITSEPVPGRPDPRLDALVGKTARMLSPAVRLLGSLAESDDVVQATYARWYATSGPQHGAVQSLGEWLTRVAGRICLDLVGSARVDRERYVSSSIPEPIPAQAAR